MKEPFLLLNVHLKRFSIQKDRLDYPSRRGEKLFRQGLSQIGHLDGLFSGSSKCLLNPGPGREGGGNALHCIPPLLCSVLSLTPSCPAAWRTFQFGRYETGAEPDPKS